MRLSFSSQIALAVGFQIGGLANNDCVTWVLILARIFIGIRGNVPIFYMLYFFFILLGPKLSRLTIDYLLASACHAQWSSEFKKSFENFMKVTKRAPLLVLGLW